MSTSPSLKLDTIDGSCHCGAVQYKVKNVDLSNLTRCNCSVCIKDGSIMTKTSGDSLLLKEEDGSYAVFTYKDNVDGKESRMRNNNLSSYRFIFDNPEFMIFRHFCNNCGIPVFVSAYASAFGGAVASINVNALKLQEAGIDRKDITRPENMGYINGQEPSFKMQKGEPWAHGCW